jgi:DUF4097 and DUF4098 domain-containing protein YvlB
MDVERSKTMKPAVMAFVAALAFPALAPAQTPVDERRPAAPDASVRIENLSGSIRVTGWEKGEVQVKGTVREGAQLSLTGNEKNVRVEVESEHMHPMGVKADIEVMVPAGSSLDVEGFQATITIAGVNGTVKAETVNGSITHSGAGREVYLQSVNGAVETTKPSGRVNVEAVNGGVTVRDASGELNASTVNGKLLVSGGSFDRVALESVSGQVRFEGALSAKASMSVETVSASVDLVFPAAFGGQFNVSTFSGQITNELGPAAEKTNEYAPGQELSFTSGSGGARVTVETLSGAVHIRKRP